MTNQPPVLTDDKFTAYAYDGMVHNPAAVQSTYASFELDTVDQWNDLIDSYTIEFHDGDHNYPSSAAMFADIATGHLWTYRTNPETDQIPTDHPMLWTVTDKRGDTYLLNDIFRAVHDLNGHMRSGGSFSLSGEFKAWIAHRDLYSRNALSALWCETRGQSAWTNAYGSHSDLPLRDRPFAQQKAGLAPLILV